jgi:Protein of unknown function (DUF4012)
MADRGRAERDEPVGGAGTLSTRPGPRAAPAVVDRVDRRRPAPAPPGPRGPSAGRWATRAVVVAAAVAGGLTSVAPSGNEVADHLLAAAFVALLAAAGASARRWSWIVVAGGALALADGKVAIGCAVAALVLVLVSARPIGPAAAVGAAVGGLAGVALLRASDLGFQGSSAVAVAIVVSPLLVSGYRFAARRTRRRVRWLAAGLAVVLVVVGGAYVAAVASARPAVERGMTSLQLGLDAARAGDEAKARSELSEAADAFGEADRRLDAWWAAPVRAVPVVGHNARAVGVMAASAADIARRGSEAAESANTDTLTVQGGRLDLVRVAALGPPLAAVQDALATAEGDLAGAASPWLVRPVADRLDRVGEEVAGARPDADLAADAVAAIPAIFGGDGRPSHWFVAFVTPVEARGRTGFMGNFAELTATDGLVDMTRFGRSGELEGGGTPGPERTVSGPADYLERWGRFDPAATWRNVTMSPDFPSVGQVVTELYPQSGGQPVDGVIAIDPVGLAALLRFTGPIAVPGVDEPLTADTAAAYLLRDQYLVDDNEARIDALESLARATFEALTGGSLPPPREIADTLAPAVREGHIHVYGAAPGHQRLFEAMGVAGDLPALDGDFLSVVDNNAVGNKVDLFLERTVTYDVDWDPGTGDLAATATVTLTNTAPDDGLPDYVIGSPLAGDAAPPRGTNRTYLSVYSPWALEGALLDGAPVGLERQAELGRFAYSLFLDIPPGGSRTLTLDLRGRLVGDRYRLDVARQPLANPDMLSVGVDVGGSGAVEASEDLTVDGRRATFTGQLLAEVATFGITVES